MVVPLKVPIAFGNDGSFSIWPLDAECRVVIADARCALRLITGTHLIKELGVVFQGLKTVGETVGDID